MIDHTRMVGVVCVVMSFYCILTGCEKNPLDNPSPHSNAARVVHDVEERVAGLSLKTTADVDVARRKCEEVADFLLKESSAGGTLAVRRLGEVLRDIGFDDNSYSSREKSLSEYFRLVTSTTLALSRSPELTDSAWSSRLNAFKRVNDEIERCRKEPSGGPYGDVTSTPGHFKTQRQYLDNLCSKRFDFIREGFETGPFTHYFHSLPKSSRDEWIRRLEEVAHRRVVIWDPKNQLIKLPRYVPEDTREWCPANVGKKREYMEDIGGGKKIKMRKVYR